MNRFFKRIGRKVVRLFSWDAARFYVMGWHDSMHLDYQAPREFDYHKREKLYKFRLSHYEDGWNMEVHYGLKWEREDRKKRIEKKNAQYRR